MTKGDDISIQIGTTQADPELSITILPDGPMIVSGEVPLRLQSIEANSEGLSVAYGDGKAFPVKKRAPRCAAAGHRARSLIAMGPTAPHRLI